MPKVSATKVRQMYGTLSDFMSRQEVIDSFEKTAKNEQLFKKAMASPKAFLRAEGFKLPSRTDFSITQQRTKLTGRIIILRCFILCFRIGGRIICIRHCIIIVIR